MVDVGWKEKKKMARITPDHKFDYLSQKIGEGTYGVVYKAKSRNPRDTREFALKKIKGESTDGLSISACREIEIVQELRHVNIVHVEEVFLEPSTRDIWLLFEYAEFDLFEIVDQHRAFNRHHKHQPNKHIFLTDHMVKSMTYQLLCGMEYLHNNWVLHRDLKPANILVMGKGPEEGRVKIADMGMARLFNAPLKPLSEVDPVVVTIWYRAPELLLGAKHYTKAVDMWAIGCIFAELMTTMPIFHGNEEKGKGTPFQYHQVEKIFHIMGTPKEEKWPGLTLLPDYPKLKSFVKPWPNVMRQYFEKNMNQNPIASGALSLLSEMLEYDPAKRITCSAAMNSEYFRRMPNYNSLQDAPIKYKHRRIQGEKAKPEEKPPYHPPQQQQQQKPQNNQHHHNPHYNPKRLRTDQDPNYHMQPQVRNQHMHPSYGQTGRHHGKNRSHQQHHQGQQALDQQLRNLQQQQQQNQGRHYQGM